MKHTALSVLSVILPLSAWASGDGDREIWFDSPCSMYGINAWNLPSDGMMNPDPEWESSSLPIGNGFIGANVTGSIAAERITLNEKSLWRGGPNTPGGASYYWDVNKDAVGAVEEIRRAFSAGDNARADSLTRVSLNGKASYESSEESPFRFGSFTTMGELLVYTGHDQEGVSGYRRSLSIDDAVAEVSFRCGGTGYRREFFVSFPDRALVMRFSADRPMEKLELCYTPNPESDGAFTSDDGKSVLYSGSLKSNGMKYAVRVAAVPRGEGETRVENGHIIVEGADDVMFVHQNGLMSGISDTTFSPSANATRAQLAVIFYRMDGSHAVDSEDTFTDVPRNSGTAWYYDAVTWAQQNGILEGYEDGTFHPDELITREQLAVVFCNYAEYKERSTAAAGDLSAFADVQEISPWAQEAMKWAVGSGLIGGKGNGVLDPRGTATRAEVAAMLHNFSAKNGI